MENKQKKKLTLVERINNGMAAVDLPPGCLVQYKSRKKGKNPETPLFARGQKPPNLSTTVTSDFYESVEVEFGSYLLYLGVVSLGPRCISSVQGTRIKLWGDTIFAHQFYYGEKALYLEISRPDRYYTVFRRHFTRVNDKNNLCR